MEHKNKSFSRIKRHQSDKVLRYSIRKYSFGAASVAVAALMFLGAHTVSADAVDAKNQPALGAPNPNEEKSPLIEPAPTAKNEETKETEKVEVAKETEKPAENNEAVENESLNNRSNNGASSEKETPASDKVVEKQTLDKSQLQASITKVQELLDKVNKEKAPASTLAAIQADLENAKNALNNNELTQAEVDAVAKTLSDKLFILSSMPKLGTPEKVVKEGKNTIANTGTHDSRNGLNMGEGVRFRADGQISSGALANIKYFASVDPNAAGNNGRRTRNDEPELTLNKTDIKAYYVQDSEGKWIVYDVFFNNDGRKMTQNSYQQHYYFQAPFNIMDSSNTVKDLTFTRYENVGGRRLSDGFQGFKQYGNTATISNPWGQQNRIFNNDGYSFYDPNSGVTRDNQRWDVFKNNQYDSTLNQLPKDKNGNYPRLSYYLGVELGRESTDYAVHMHAKIKLKNDITEAEANAYGRVYAASVTKGFTTNQSYIMGTLGTSLTPRDTTPPTITANNATVTSREQITPISVTAEDNRGGVGMRDNNPIEVSGLPQGLTYANNRITGTPTGAPGNSTVTIKAYDKNGNMATKTITITVRSQADVYNPTGARLTVNQNHTITDNEVKAKVSNFAPGTLSVVSKPSTANPGNVGNAVVKVTYPDGSSENVNVPVTVLEAPDTQAPTLAITPANQTVVEGQNVTFTVTARDNKIVNLDTSDFITKYGSRLVNSKASATNVKNTDTEKIRTITITTTAEDVGKTNTITFNATDNANHSATPVSFTFTVTRRDNIPPTITAGDATVTKNEPITPISVTAVDNPGGVGMRDNNPIEVTGLPSGLTYANNRITGTPTGAPGNSTVTIKAYDKNGNMAPKTITITVRSQADAHNPTATGLTVNQNHTITDDELKAKVSNYAPGTLSIVSKPSTANAGNAGNAVVKVTYQDGTIDNVNVPVTVTDVTGPTITAESATVTKNESITPIPITAVDNPGGVGMRDNNPIEVTNIPAGLTYANNQITGTPTAGVGYYTVTVKAYDKNNRSTTKQIRITVRSQAEAHNPTGAGLTVNQNHTITNDELKAKVSDYAPGTLSIVSRPSTANAGNAGNAVVKVTYQDGTFDNVNVPVTVTDVTGPTITSNNATVTNREQITPIPVTAEDNTGGVGMRQNNPIEVIGLPSGLTYANGRITGTPTGPAGNSTVTIKAYDRNNTPTTKEITITVQSQAEAHNPTGAGLTVNQNHTITDDELKAKVSDYAPGTLSIVSKPSTANAGNAGNAVVKVTYPDGTFDDVNVPVTVTDVTGPTITAESATVTKNESITPIPITAVDNPGGVGMRDNNPIEVTNVPAGLTYANNQITGTPTAGIGYYTVTIKAYDKNNRLSTKQIRITVQGQAEKYNPTATELTVNQNEDITIEKLTPKVNNPGAGTLSLVSKPSTTTAGSAGNAVVKVTYSDGSHDLVNVPITVKDVIGPTITANNATVTNREDITPIPVTAEDNTGGVGMRDTNPIVVTGLPEGLTYANGQITGKPTGTAGESTVTITAYDKNDNPSTTTIKITVQSQADAHNPRGERLTVDKDHPIEDAEVIAKVKDHAPATLLTVKSKPSTATVGDVADAVVTVTYPDGSSEDVNVPVTVRDVLVPDTTGPTITANGATVTKNEPIDPILVTAEDNPGGVGMRDNDPIVVRGLPNGLTFTDGKITGTPTADKGEYSVTIEAFDKNNNRSDAPITIKIIVKEQTDKYNPTGEGLTVNQGHEITDDEVKAKVKDFGPGTLIVTSKPSTTTAGSATDAVVNVTYPDGSHDTVNVPVTVKDVTGPTVTADGATVTNREPIPEISVTAEDNPGGVGMRDNNPIVVTDLPEGLTFTNGKITGTPTGTAGTKQITITAYDKNNTPTTKVIEIVVQEQKVKYNPTGETLTVPYNHNITDDEVKAKVQNFGPGTLSVQSKPLTNTSGNVGNAVVIVTYPDGSTGIVNVPVVVGQPNEDDYTPQYNDGNGKPGTSVEIPVSEANGKTIPAGTTYTSLTPGVVTVDDKGKVTVTIPSDKNPGDEVTGKVLVRYPDGSTEEVPVKVTVINQDKDDYTPQYNDGNGKPGASVEIPVSEANGKTIPAGTTYTSLTPGVVTVDDKGKVTVTIPSDKNPGDEVTGKVLVRYPDGSTEEVPVKVIVTTPARKTPMVELEQNPKTGDVTVTPKKPDGSAYPPGTKVEIPGKNGTPIVVIIGQDGKGTIPNNELPDGKVPGTGKITEPGKPAVEVPNVTTPKKLDPNAPQTEQPGKIEITRKPNGDAVVTPKKPDGSTYPPGTTVVIPGDNNTPIEVTIGDNGSGEVPNDKLPKGELPGKGTVTEPNKRPSQPVDVTTPARKTPTVELEQDPKTGDVTVTPKKPDGSTYPPGTKVEIPGKNGSTITVIIGQDGKGKVPNSELPDGEVPGVAKITEPGKPAEKAEITTPARKTPTVELEQDPKTGDVTVTPKKPDGSTYPPGTKVEIPGKNGNTITVIIGQDGKGKVPNSDLPDGKVPGIAKITEPGKPTEEVPVVTTPARKTPTVELDQDPNTGDVTVIPKKPDGSTYPPGTKVEIPGKNGNTITVIIGQDGKGKIPNSELPDGKVSGVAKITEPGKPTVEVPVVVTPAKIRTSEKGEPQSQKSSDNKENSTDNKSTKRLANTGESETNTGLAGLGLAMFGSALVVAKRRRENEE